jgi:hypothetical protein
MNTSSSIAHRRYLLCLAMTLAGAAAAVLCFIVLVDPYGLYRLVSQPGFNAVKPGLTRHQELIKLSNALAVKPQLVILGNSRAEIGFDPATLPGRFHEVSAYNLAIPGTSLQTSWRELRALHANGIRPATVIVGVEFLDFLARDTAPPANPPGPTEGSELANWGWRADVLFSLASLKDAVRTVLIQGNGEAVTIAPNGYNPLHEYLAYARNDGYHILFEQAAQSSLNSLQRKLPAIVRRDDFTHLRKILTAAAASDAEVELLIYPYHARMMVAFETLGIWPHFEQWKAQLVAEIAKVQGAAPGARIRLTDFSGFGPYNCEPIPGKRERHLATQWYWEAGHFKKALGDRMLQRVLAPGTVGEADGFGMPLASGNMVANAARIERERGECKRSSPALFAAAGTPAVKAP